MNSELKFVADLVTWPRLNPPAVSIVMGAYNAEAFIEEAISSLISQTISDIEIIVVDDGSADETALLVQRMAKSDARVCLIRLDTNQGQSSALNRGVAQARGKYLALLDADDLAVPERLALQMRAFEANPNLILVGGAVQTLCAQTSELGHVWKYECEDQNIRALSIFKSVFINGTMMFNLAKFREQGLQFNTRLRYGADWAISLDAMRHGEVANLPDVLMHYRIHGGQLTARMSDTINCDSAHIRRNEIARLGVDSSREELQTHLAVSPCKYWSYGSHPYFQSDKEQIAGKARTWFDKLSAANSESQHCSSSVFNRLLQELREKIDSTIEQVTVELTDGFHCPVVAPDPCNRSVDCRRGSPALQSIVFHQVDY